MAMTVTNEKRHINIEIKFVSNDFLTTTTWATTASWATTLASAIAALGFRFFLHFSVGRQLVRG